MGNRVSSEEEKWKEINENWWLRRFLRSKWKVPIIAMLIATIFLSLLFFEILPGTYGDYFVSITWEVGAELGYSGQGPFTMHVIMPDGWNGDVVLIAPHTCDVYNRYFMPVRIHNNEFKEIFLVYDSPVNNPADVKSNREHLIWGAFYTVDSAFPFSFEYNCTDRYRDGVSNYDYYVSRMELKNYTYVISYHHMRWAPGFDSFGGNTVVWYGQDLNSNPIKPGVYYLYFIMYGIVAEPAPIAVNITRVYEWWWR